MPEVIQGAGGVVFYAEDQVLLLQHVSQDWLFPKGHIDPGETALQAALREVHEEAGVQARCLSAQMTYTTNYVNRYGQRREILWFPMEADQHDTYISEPSFLRADFFSLPVALTMLSFAEDRRLLEQLWQWRQSCLPSRPML